MGLLTDPRQLLAAQIRAQYQTGQGGSGSWDDAGFDRALELADLLMAQGITDLGQLSFADTPWTEAARSVETGANGQIYEVPESSGVNRKLRIGDKEVGYLGDYNNDGTFGSKSQPFLKSKTGPDGQSVEELLGWSARGDGNTSYRVITDPETGQLVIAPGWNSSSDAKTAREAAIATAAMVAAGYGAAAMGGGAAGAGGAAPALTGVDAAMASYAASGGGAGLFTPAAAAGAVGTGAGVNLGMGGATAGDFGMMVGADGLATYGGVGAAEAAGAAAAGTYVVPGTSPGTAPPGTTPPGSTQNKTPGFTNPDGSLDWGKLLAMFAGGAAGLADSKDKTLSTTQTPWEPAQPYLKGLLEEGSDLYAQSKAEPFSPSQQSGYANIGGLLDLTNSNAGGLLQGFQANASGQNQFVRGQPKKLIGSSFNPTAEQWQPGLFGNFGTKR